MCELTVKSFARHPDKYDKLFVSNVLSTMVSNKIYFKKELVTKNIQKNLTTQINIY